MGSDLGEADKVYSLANSPPGGGVRDGSGAASEPVRTPKKHGSHLENPRMLFGLTSTVAFGLTFTAHLDRFLKRLKRKWRVGTQ